MAATSTKSNTFTPDLEAVTERAREANRRFVDVSRQVTAAYLDGIEKYTAELTKFERKLGEQTELGAAAGVFNAHAQLTEDVAKASVTAARELISA
jgi:hypothetical protein